MTKKLRNCSIDSVKDTKIKLTRKQTFENKVGSDFRTSRKMVKSSTLKNTLLKMGSAPKIGVQFGILTKKARLTAH